MRLIMSNEDFYKKLRVSFKCEYFTLVLNHWFEEKALLSHKRIIINRMSADLYNEILYNEMNYDYLGRNKAKAAILIRRNAI